MLCCPFTTPPVSRDAVFVIWRRPSLSCVRVWTVWGSRWTPIILRILPGKRTHRKEGSVTSQPHPIVDDFTATLAAFPVRVMCVHTGDFVTWWLGDWELAVFAIFCIKPNQWSCLQFCLWNYPHQLPDDDALVTQFFFFFGHFGSFGLEANMIPIVGTQLRNWVACWVPYWDGEGLGLNGGFGWLIHWYVLGFCCCSYYGCVWFVCVWGGWIYLGVR